MTGTGHQRKSYHLNQSPLYKLNSRNKLASLLGMPLRDVERIAKRSDNYNVFEIFKNPEKPRKIEVPKPHLEKIHYKLFNLLKKIEPPTYLHSGVKGRSYITNGKAHIGASRLTTLDIYKFYPSTLGWHIFDFFHGVMRCSKDVAALLTAISTYNNHVPTGSCLSQSIAFYAHYEMFEEINSLAITLGLNFTCYVDDIAISGEKANRSTLYKVRGILKRRGLKSPKKKERLFNKGYPKVVTGSIVCEDGLRLPNRKHKKIYEDIQKILMSEDSEEKAKLLNATIGRVVAASQADSSIKHRLKLLHQEKKSLEV